MLYIMLFKKTGKIFPCNLHYFLGIDFQKKLLGEGLQVFLRLPIHILQQPSCLAVLFIFPSVDSFMRMCLFSETTQEGRGLCIWIKWDAVQQIKDLSTSEHVSLKTSKLDPEAWPVTQKCKLNIKPLGGRAIPLNQGFFWGGGANPSQFTPSI